MFAEPQRVSLQSSPGSEEAARGAGGSLHQEFLPMNLQDHATEASSLFDYETPEEPDAPGKTGPINTSIVLRDFIKIAPVLGTSIEATSGIKFGEDDEHKLPRVKTLDFVTTVRRIYQASRKGHRVLERYLETHPGLRFAVPDAQDSDCDNWYTDIQLNLQKAWGDLYPKKPTSASRKVGFNV